MQDSFSANMLALVQTEEKKFEPKILNLKEIIYYYVKHQEEIIRRRTKYDLEKAEARGTYFRRFKEGP